MFKKLLLFATFVALFSCTKPDDFSLNGEIMTVSVESLSSGTKSELSGTSVIWSTSDQFGLYNGVSTALYTKGSGSQFTTTSPVKKADQYSVFYPYSAIVSSESTGFNVNVPDIQQYAYNSFANGAFLMVGTTTNISSATFYNVMGVIDFKFSTPNPTVLDRIEVISNNPVSGSAFVSLDKTITMNGGSTTITLECNTSVTSEPTDFMVVVPPGTHNLTVNFYNVDGGKCTAKYKDFKVERSKIYYANVNKSFSEPDTPAIPDTSTSNEHIILLNEGNWQSDNGQVSYIFNHSITNQWFRSINGTKVGDTPQDVLYIPEKNLVAISVNWSNIVYFIRPTGELVAQTENVPNCRSLATDGEYLYITSYAHETALGETYTRGYVAKISLTNYHVVSTCEVGYEPEGVAYYNGNLYVANTGGYAFSEGHDYEHTVSVVNAQTMTKLRDVELYSPSENPVINLYGEMSQSGQYLMINSPGDYNSIAPASVIFNCADDTYEVFEDLPCTYNTVLPDGKFLAVGSSFSYVTGGYEYFNWYYDPADCSMDEISDMGFLASDFQNPYCVYCNPYTGHIYVTDACNYASAGKVYEYYNGSMVGEPLRCYINPGHMIALPDYAMVRTKSQFSPIVVSQCKARSNNKLSINDYYRNLRK